MSSHSVATIAISAIGITANLIVILILIITKAFKKGSTKWYVLQLAIADALFLITVAVHAQFAVTGKPLFRHGCRAFWTMFYVNWHSSVIFITVMAIDRYYAIAHEFSAIGQKLRRRRWINTITVIVWLLSFVASLPAAIYSDDTFICRIEFPKSPNLSEVISDRDPRCEIARDSRLESAYYWFEFVITFLVPLITTGTCYALLIRYSLLSRFRATGRYLDPNRKRVIITCVVLVVIFMICWTPHHAKILALMKGIDASGQYCDTLAMVATYLVYMNSAVNPFVYFIMIHVRQHMGPSGKVSYTYSALKAYVQRICCCKNNGDTINA